MEFRKLFSNTVLVPLLLVIFVIGVVLWKFTSKTESSTTEGDDNVPLVNQIVQDSPAEVVPADDTEIQQQLDRDREEQKQTKYLKNKLEQTNLELEQEKAMAQINKLKMENTGVFKDPSLEEQNGFPEVKVQYIGGDSVKKEAILSIAGTSFQVKEKSSPIDNIQVVSISDSSVTLHFSTPQELTKTIDYKPE